MTFQTIMLLKTFRVLRFSKRRGQFVGSRGIYSLPRELVFHPFPQTPAQPKTTFLSHAYPITFVGRDEKRAPLKTPAWEAKRFRVMFTTNGKREFVPRDQVLPLLEVYYLLLLPKKSVVSCRNHSFELFLSAHFLF